MTFFIIENQREKNTSARHHNIQTIVFHSIIDTIELVSEPQKIKQTVNNIIVG